MYGATILRNCLYCKLPFNAPVAEIKRRPETGARFCSRECRNKSTHICVTKNCLICKKEIIIVRKKNLKQIVCSSRCFGALITKRVQEKRKEIGKRCKQCNKVMLYAKNYKQQVFCNKNCSDKFKVIIYAEQKKIRLKEKEKKKIAKKLEFDAIRKEIAYIRALLNADRY